jgi:acetyl esterase/lipase
MGSFVSWAQLAAASGLVAITYANREPGDVHELFRHVRQHAASLGIDDNRLGVWACSGHGPAALSFLMEHSRDGLKCAALLYPYTLDLDGSTHVAEAARQFHFVTPAAGKSVSDLPAALPLLVARAGGDQMPGLNRALDRFVGAAVTLDLPVTLVNHAAAPHAFDLFDDTRASRDVVKQTLAFMQCHLRRDEESARAVV